MTVTALTTACHRPEAFALCEKYVSRQTVKPDQWLILDDDDPKTICTMGQEYHYWPEFRGRQSLAKKIRRALERNLIKGDALVVLENDDWVAADYIEWCVEGLKQFVMFGEGRALYYNVQQRFWFEHINLKHASLCATSLRREMYPKLLEQCVLSTEPYVDEPLWFRNKVGTHVADPYRPGNRRRTVGIKAMPGRMGYGGGHRGRDRSAKSDLQLEKLKSLIGADADAYAQFYKPTAPPLPLEKNGHIEVKRTMKNIARSEAGRVHGPQWLIWLEHLIGQPHVVGLEVGTFEGDSAEWMLENVFTHPDSHYHCVDPFTGSIEHKIGGFKTEHLEQVTRAKLSKFKNVTIHKGYSQQVLRELKAPLSFAYIDADHASRSVLRDSVFAFELLNVGGRMVWDDFLWAVMPNELDRPRTGIEAFLKIYAKHLRLLDPPKGWQVCAEKISE